MDNRVFVIACPDYGQAEAAIAALLAQMGGIERYLQAGEEILLKVNLLQPAAPERAVSTHPAVVAAVANCVRAAGGSACIADSPGSGYPFTAPVLREIYRRNGMDEAAAASGAMLNFDASYEAVSFPRGKLMKQFEVMTPVCHADGIFNLCKLKTHLFMGMTGGVKNSFGVIPGLAKVGYHARLQEKEQFADMLLDLADYVSPRLTILDAVLAMEGEGPGASGTPRQLGLLLASENPLALDVIAAEIIGLKKQSNPLLLAAARRGLSPTEPDEITLIGAPLDSLRVADFRLPATLHTMMGAQRLTPLAGAIKRALTHTPRVDPSVCVGCGICRDACPAKAIALTGQPRRARIDTKHCIRCYCCHELCPHSAVALKAGLLMGRGKKTRGG